MKKARKKIIIGIIIALTIIFLFQLNKTIKSQININVITRFSTTTHSLSEVNKYDLQPGLNIIPIDLGGPIDSDRANGAYGDSALLEQNGNYLLMDTGTDDANDVLINFLKSQEVNKLSIYISHYHNDHYAKIKDILRDSYFTVENVYLPNPNIISSKLDESASWYNEINEYVTIAENLKNDLIGLGTNVVLIEKGSKINLGDAKIDVIWDLTESSLTPNEYYQDSYGSLKNHFMNDTSLITKVSYKGIKFLNAGDIEARAEEEIIEKNVDVKADIFKCSHHGGASSNI